MADQSTDPAALLGQLLRLPAEERLARARAAGALHDLVPLLCDEASKLAIADLEQALEATEWLLEVANETGDARLRAGAGRARAQSLAWANRHDEALAMARTAIEIAGDAGLTVEVARARMAMMQVLDRMGRSDEAMQAGEAAREAFSAADEPILAARAEANLGIANRMQNRPDVALEHFDRARAVLGSDPVVAAQIDSNRAEALLELNEFAEAERAFESALAAFRGAGVGRAVAIVEGNLADLMSRQGRLPRALLHFEQARRVLESDGAAPGDIARIEAEQAEAFAQAGLDDEAFEGFRAALAALEAHGMAAEAARARLGLARVLDRRSDDTAGEMLRLASEEFERLGHSTALGRTRLARGEWLARRGAVDEARVQFESALELLDDRPADAAVALYHLARLAIEREALEEAAPLIETAIVSAETLGLPPLLADLLHTRALHRARMGDAEAALVDLEAAAAHVDRIRGSLQADRLRAAFQDARFAVYEDLVLAHLDRGDAASAFDAAERARARALLDLVGQAVRSDAGATASAAEGTDMEAAIESHCAELDALYSRASDLVASGIERWRRRVEVVDRRLQTLESRLASTRGLTEFFAPPLDSSAAARVVPAGAALVEYFVARGELIVFVLRADGSPRAVRLGAVAAVERALDDVRFQVSTALARTSAGLDVEQELVDDARADLRVLHDLLLAPIAEMVTDARSLLFVPAGPLHGVPFSALFDGTRFVIERYEVTVAPSASLLGHLGNGSSGGPLSEHAVLVVGVSDEAAPHIADEATAIGAMLPGCTLLDGAAATRARVLEELGRVRIAHIACHARFARSAPTASGLRLSDGWLTPRDLSGLSLDGAVVILSGCETGAGWVTRGDEVLGLVRAFVAGGASSVLTSLWMLDDAMARDFMEDLHELWYTQKSGTGSLAAALRSTQIALMQRRPHPAFWAAIALVGVS